MARTSLLVTYVAKPAPTSAGEFTLAVECYRSLLGKAFSPD